MTNGRLPPHRKAGRGNHPSSLEQLLARYDGQPIPHCPGRYVLRGVTSHAAPTSLTGAKDGAPTEHIVPRARDRVVVTRLGDRGDWGLISYARPDGTWLHTVNTPEGFRRKLADLGIMFPPP